MSLEMTSKIMKMLIPVMPTVARGCIELMEDIQCLIKHSSKDLPLSGKLNLELEEMLSEDLSDGSGGSEDPQVLLTRLLAFRKHTLIQIAKSHVIQNPTVVLVRINPEMKLQNLDKGQYLLPKLYDGEEGETAAISSSEVKLFGLNWKTKPELEIKSMSTPKHTKQNVNLECLPTKNWIKNKKQENIRFSCHICNKEFRKKGHRKRHLLTHGPEKPFGCDFCSKRFSAKLPLQMHLLNRHKTGSKPFKCDKCQQQFTLKKELDQHILSHVDVDCNKSSNYPCSLCKQKFITKECLSSHLETHSGANTYHCGHCDKIFPKKYNLTRHERTHSTETSYHCNFCNKDFRTKTGIHMHLQAHELDENKTLSCHLCGKSFAAEQSLELHISYHKQADEKPFPCALCEVRFKTQERLDIHFETHGSIAGRVYPCQYCEKTFPRRYNLVRHELSHTHGRRKPKDGLPTSIRHGFRHCDDDLSDDENGTMASGTYFDENSKNDSESNSRYSYSNNSISKSELVTTLFGVGDVTNNTEEPPAPITAESSRFKTQERLDTYFETHVSIAGRVYPCQYCEKTFPRKFNLVRHELSHTHGRRKPKDGLPIKIANENIAEVQTDVTHILPNDNQEAGNAAGLAVDNSIHSSMMSFDSTDLEPDQSPISCENFVKFKSEVLCNVCNQEFETEYELNGHIQAHNLHLNKLSVHARGGKQPKCSTPSGIRPEGVFFDDDSTSEMTTTTTDDNSINSMNASIISHCSGGPDSNISQSSSCEFLSDFKSVVLTCIVCGKDLETENELNMHIQNHNRDRSSKYALQELKYIDQDDDLSEDENQRLICNVTHVWPTLPTITANMKQPVYPCLHCKNYYSTQFFLDRHMLTKHPINNSNDQFIPSCPSTIKRDSKSRKSDNLIPIGSVKEEDGEEEIERTESGYIIGF